MKPSDSQSEDEGSTPSGVTIEVQFGSPCKKTEQGVTPIGNYLARARGKCCLRLLQVLPHNELVGSEWS